MNRSVSPEISTGNEYPDIVQYHQQYGNWSPSPPQPPLPPPPGNYGYQTPEVEAKPYFGGPVSPVPVAADEASIRSNGPETDLRRTLEEKHVNMIGFSMALGVGLFLSSGKVIFLAGPGLAVLAYLLTGTLMWSALACMAEMTALFPVKGPTFEFARRFIDESVGYASAWMLWFAYVIIVAAELAAIAEIFRFQVPLDYLEAQGYPERPLEWSAGVTTSPAVWVGLFLVVMLVVNLLPVRKYGQMEYLSGSVKLFLLVIFILINTILNARQRFHSSRFWTYESPLGFSTDKMVVTSEVTLHGSTSTFLAFWTAMITSFFSLQGWDVILLTAPENRDVARDETIKMSTRKITLRVMLLYALAIFTVGLNVPSDDAQLQNLTLNGVGGGSTSVFVIAAIREHVVGLPHFLNGFYVFSACTTGIASLYSASRILHAIASLREAWPAWGWAEAIRSRLERTHFGVPMNSVMVSWLFGFLAFLSTKPESSQTLGRLTAIIGTATLIVYAVNSYTFILFYKEINKAACGFRDDELNLTPEMRFQYDRENKRQYPYRSHLQWLRALYSLVFCLLMILFQGWRTLVNPASGEDFVAFYIAIPIFLFLSGAYFVKTRGFRPSGWHRRAQKLAGLEAIGPVLATDPYSKPPCKTCGMRHRRGRLVLPRREGANKQKAVAILEWLWVWLKL
ncbi:Amino acid permease domain containing protein [Naviculisporaceae sp. PSN 640]